MQAGLGVLVMDAELEMTRTDEGVLRLVDGDARHRRSKGKDYTGVCVI